LGNHLEVLVGLAQHRHTLVIELVIVLLLSLEVVFLVLEMTRGHG
jgi:hypothetical protein